MIVQRKEDNLAAKEVIRYKEATWQALKKLEAKPFITTNLCISIVQCIKQNTAGIRRNPGTTLSNSRGETIYTPPAGEGIIRAKMADLERFIHEDHTIDPLLKMALIHYQFEAIHPFVDGNGRTGRIIILLYLKLAGLLHLPVIYLSGYIIRHKKQYYQALRNVTEHADWSGYLHYMLDMIEQTAKDALYRLESITQLMETFRGRMQHALPKAYSKELLEALFRLPYNKRQHLVDAGLGTAKTVGNYLSALEKAGLLESRRVGKEKLYLNRHLLSVLEE